jgi:hypothetical protein
VSMKGSGASKGIDGRPQPGSYSDKRYI